MAVFDGTDDIPNLCSGDSSYFARFLEDPQPLFHQVAKEVEFLPREALTFRIFGKTLTLPRDKQFFGDVTEDGSYPLYRYGNFFFCTLIQIVHLYY